MELPIREAKVRFTEAAAAASLGERVIIIKHGHPFVELIAAKSVPGFAFERAAQIGRDLGLDGLTVQFSPDFDDPGFNREVLGLRD